MTEQHKKSGLEKTQHLSTRKLDDARRLRRHSSEQSRVSLLFYYRDGVEVASLREGDSLTIGRSHPADLTIADESLSRQHAVIEIINGELWVEDLDSTNGTRVDGIPIERVKLTPDSELVFGTVAVGVHTPGSGEVVQEGLDGHDRFHRLLETEVERAKTFGRELALVIIRGARGSDGHVRRWLPRVQRRLRSFDYPALYSSNTVEVLLPEAGTERARDLAQAFVVETEGLRCGVGSFPHHASSADELLEVVGAALRGSSRRSPVLTASSALRTVEARPANQKTEGSGPVARSSAMARVLKAAGQFADTALPVLIRGETGTGKEVVSRAIHEGSKRCSRPMVCVNCGAIPAHLVESTLFGHEKGAFTGADKLSKGVFESAAGGTIMLDEIGEMPQQAQVALLRVLESKRFSRVGSTKEIKADVKIIAATHRPLESMCDSGEFRRDLFYRLDVMAVRIPSLRERPDDIEPLVARFIRDANEANERKIEDIDAAALEVLKVYPWPGNVRELRNAIERAVVIAGGPLITVADLPDRVRQLASHRPSSAPPEERVTTSVDVNPIDLKTTVARYEKGLVIEALEMANWNRTEAANALGLPLRTLAFKVSQHNIKKPS